MALWRPDVGGELVKVGGIVAGCGAEVGEMITSPYDQPISSQLEQALAMEEYHRDQLIFWRRRRVELENTLQQPIDELSQIAEEAFNANDNDPDPL